MEKGLKDQGGESIKNYGQEVMSVRTPEGFVRKSAWQVADVRRPKLRTACSSGRMRRTS